MSQVPPSAPPAYQPPAPGKPAGLAIASMVLGIVSCALLCVWWLSIPCGILAIVFGIIAGNKVKAGEGGGAGMAKAGLIMGIIGPAIAVLLLILIIAGCSAFTSELEKAIEQQRQQQQQQTNP